MSNPTSNFGWVMPTATDLVTDLPADFAVFGQAVDTSMSELLGGTTGQVLAKTSATNMDFTWTTPQVGDITDVAVTSPITGGGSSGAVTIGIQDATTAVKGAVQLSDSTSTTSSVLASTPTATKSAYDLANAAIAKTTVTTAGDIIYRNATVPTRLGIGTASQVLAVNSGATAPEWVTPATGALVLVKSQAIGTAVSSVTVTSAFSSAYDAYKIVIGGTGVGSTAGEQLLLQLGSTTTNYDTAHQSVDYSGSAIFTNGASGAANFARAGAVKTTYQQMNLDLVNPYNAAYTFMSAWYDYYTAAGWTTGIQRSTTSFTAFTILLGGGTITGGTVYVYGYKNS